MAKNKTLWEQQEDFIKEASWGKLSEGEGINAIDLHNFPHDFEQGIWNRFVDEMDIENILVFTGQTILSNNDTAEITRYQI